MLSSFIHLLKSTFLVSPQFCGFSNSLLFLGLQPYLLCLWHATKRSYLWPNIWSILENAPCALERNVLFESYKHTQFKIYFDWCWYITSDLSELIASCNILFHSFASLSTYLWLRDSSLLYLCMDHFVKNCSFQPFDWLHLNQLIGYIPIYLNQLWLTIYKVIIEKERFPFACSLFFVWYSASPSSPASLSVFLSVILGKEIF